MQKRMQLDRIVLDHGLQRRSVKQFLVDEYAVAMGIGLNVLGDVFEPIVVWMVSDRGGAPHVVDGFHRYFANRQNGATEIDTVVHHGTYREAWLDSFNYNHSHGARLTLEEKNANLDHLMADSKCRGYSTALKAKMTGLHENTILFRFPPDVVIRKINGRVQVYEKKKKKPVPQLPQEIREQVRDTRIAESPAEQRKLAILEPDLQEKIAGMVVERKASGVTDALRQIDKQELREAVGAPGFVSDVPVDPAKMHDRGCRRIHGGIHALRLDLDDLGKDRLVEIIKGRTGQDFSERITLPGKEAALAIRELLREGWERDIRVGLKGSTPQAVVARNVRERGCAKGYNEETFAARQLARCIEELAKAALCFTLPQGFAELIADAGKEARKWLDNEDAWTMLGGARVRKGEQQKALGGLADVMVSLFCAGDALDGDLAAEAVAKSRADVPRGAQ